MKKLLALALGCLLVTSLLAQDSTGKAPQPKRKIDLSGRNNDHLMIQFGYAGWNGRPDSIHTSGFPHTFNVYFMFDFPFKTNPHLSLGVGPGIGSEHMYFSKTYIGLKDISPTLRFQDLSDTTHFKRYQLSTTWVEVPLEIRYSQDPENPGKGWKAAAGLKFGALLNSHTKGKTWVNSNGNTLINYTEKIISKRYFNTTRIMATARVGYGHISLFANYQLTPLFKQGVAAQILPFSAGITLSGL
ncbi:MAG TPA: outer membrane beta-barrel protein [Chitinophagaceae bacterium]|nr:outer membrane beta-barrel protein [Chitinophagaceae bacterium]